MEKRRAGQGKIEQYVIEKVDFETKAREFFRGLTPRQLSVAALLIEGFDQKTIAEAFGVSPSAIQQRVEDIRVKASIVWGVPYKIT